jgi:hypothetical protein
MGYMYNNVGMHVDSKEFFYSSDLELSKTPLVAFVAMEANTRIVVFDVNHEDSLRFLSYTEIKRNKAKVINLNVKYEPILPGIYFFPLF